MMPQTAFTHPRPEPAAALPPSLASDMAEKAERDRLARVWTLAQRIWSDPVAAVEFLQRRHVLLDDQTPRDVASTSDEGAQWVIALLRRLDSGLPA